MYLRISYKIAIGYSPLPARAGQHDSAARQIAYDIATEGESTPMRLLDDEESTTKGNSTSTPAIKE